MEITGTYNDITRLMTLIGSTSDESSETETSSKTKSSHDTTASSSSTDSKTASQDLVSLTGNGYGITGLLGSVIPNQSVLTSLEEKTTLLQEHFLGALNTKLEEAGIDTDTPITLKRNADGSIEVAGDHPDKEAIEALFAEEPVLGEAFNAIADQSELARKIKAERNVTFSRSGGMAAYVNASLTSSSSDTDSFFASMLGDSLSTWFDSE
ncbi:hypothetical protein G3N56_15065 [Desulfovibrio sulfodismutans]|uniref:Uncharacterized protein n=1 Tax=Desulfolutivibrio sulfodismutans TaxID=63561 RepID=A0A7K3NPD6_9BACT|nr:hypothetical protein [Desulfolutivibrio sulfodismutans]NDY58054.1 hypothetical protein [Desulfolutivibrio sulfodismutans]QLA13653.1 hypothetical protein GD606_15970 [Desulfolutivibrio sulfodismutans DSM 3696]